MPEGCPAPQEPEKRDAANVQMPHRGQHDQHREPGSQSARRAKVDWPERQRQRYPIDIIHCCRSFEKGPAFPSAPFPKAADGPMRDAMNCGDPPSLIRLNDTTRPVRRRDARQWLLGSSDRRCQLRLTFRKEVSHRPTFAFSQPIELEQRPIVRGVETHDHRVFVCHAAIPLIGRERTSLSAGGAPIPWPPMRDVITLQRRASTNDG